MSKAYEPNWERSFWFLFVLIQLGAVGSRIEKAIRGLDGYLENTRENWTDAGSAWGVTMLVAFSAFLLWGVVKWARA